MAIRILPGSIFGASAATSCAPIPTLSHLVLPLICVCACVLYPATHDWVWCLGAFWGRKRSRGSQRCKEDLHSTADRLRVFRLQPVRVRTGSRFTNRLLRILTDRYLGFNAANPFYVSSGNVAKKVECLTECNRQNHLQFHRG